MTHITKLKKYHDWAYNHNDKKHPKYTTLSHSLLITLKSIMIFLFGGLLFRYYFLE